jgi:hypothetical protein
MVSRFGATGWRGTVRLPGAAAMANDRSGRSGHASRDSKKTLPRRDHAK